MAFKRVLVLIQVGVASLHRRQAHEQKNNLQNEIRIKRTTLQNKVRLNKQMPS